MIILLTLWPSETSNWTQHSEFAHKIQEILAIFFLFDLETFLS